MKWQPFKGNSVHFRPLSCSWDNRNFLKWTTFIPYQIHFKQYCMQMTQRLRLLSVHLPVMEAGLQVISRNISFELSNIYLWSTARRLSLNFDKTKYMIFHTSGCKMDDISLDAKIENNIIERFREFNFLGLTINETMTWSSHVGKIA